MNNQFLIAANSKRGQLIFSIFRKIDLIIALSGLGVSTLLFFIVKPDSLLTMIITLFPVLSCSFLVIPIPNYQNILCIVQNIYKFYFVERQQFNWRGWCAKNEFKD